MTGKLGRQIRDLTLATSLCPASLAMKAANSLIDSLRMPAESGTGRPSSISRRKAIAIRAAFIRSDILFATKFMSRSTSFTSRNAWGGLTRTGAISSGLATYRACRARAQREACSSPRRSSSRGAARTASKVAAHS